MRLPSFFATAGALAGFLGLAAGSPAGGPPPIRGKLGAEMAGSLAGPDKTGDEPVVLNQALVTGAKMSRMVYDYFNARAR